MKHKICVISLYSNPFLILIGGVMCIVASRTWLPYAITVLLVGLLDFWTAFILIDKGYLDE